LAAKKKTDPKIRSMHFDLPEEQMLKIVRVAQLEGKSSHQWTADLVAAELEKRGRV
jgi:hypothetical protein